MSKDMTQRNNDEAHASKELRVDSRLLDADLSGYEFSWQGELFNGTALELGPQSGAILSETEYKDGIQCGFCREWYKYPDQLKTEEHYFYNTRDGMQREWYPNGQLKEEMEIELGTILRHTEWDENGVQIINVINE